MSGPQEGFEESPAVRTERMVLEAMMLSRPAAEEVMEILGEQDFALGQHQEIFAAAADLIGAGKAHDHAAVAAHLRAAGSRTPATYLFSDLTDQIPSVANAGHYARIAADYALFRRMADVGTRIARWGHEGAGEAAEMLERARDEVAAIGAPAAADDTFARVGDLFARVVDELEKPHEPGDAIELPYAHLQDKLGGLRPGQVVVVGARPSVGKTVVGVDIARHAAMRLGVATAVFSLEMTKDELMHRIISAEAQVSITTLRNRTQGDAEWERISRVRERFDAAPLWLDDHPTIAVPHIRARLRYMARTRAAGLVVVDYLQLMEGGGRPENRQVEVSKMARGLKKLAQEFRVPVVLLSQLNRESTRRVDKKPQMADLRESGAVEQDSDIVLLLHREDMHDMESARAGEIDLIVEKNRQGGRGTVTCAFQGHYSRVVDMAAG